MLHQSLAVVADPGEDASCAVAVTLAHRRAAIEQCRSAARARTGNDQIGAERAAGKSGGEPVGHLVVDRRPGLGTEAIKAVPHIAQSRLQDEFAAVGISRKARWGCLLLARSRRERRGRRQVAVTDIGDVRPLSQIHLQQLVSAGALRILAARARRGRSR